MCGIFGAVSSKNIQSNLIVGLQKLEYRGYDSSGLSIFNGRNKIKRLRRAGKIKELKKDLSRSKLAGLCGIAHTRWATHGEPILKNSHPHNSNCVSIVHNGIIENSDELKKILVRKKYKFTSDTDSEVIAHLLSNDMKNSKNYVKSILSSFKKLRGSFAIGALIEQMPNTIIAACSGSPLLIGLSEHGNFISSDLHALSKTATKYITLNDDEIAIIKRDSVQVYSSYGKIIQKELHATSGKSKSIAKNGYKHFMQKEIFEQHEIISKAIKYQLGDKGLLPNIFGPNSDKILSNIKHIHFVACGTSHNAALVAKYWIEELTDVICTAEIASEYRYRDIQVPDKTLFVAISQSGETADTIYSLKKAKGKRYKNYLSICNVPESTITRLSDLVYLTHAGPEISVASTKAFTSQLIALLFLTMILTRFSKNKAVEKTILKQIKTLPQILKKTLQLEKKLKDIAKNFKSKSHALFLGRGISYPIALEAALKLKEITYIHAEGYAAGELKHGPLALVDKNMPVVGLMPDNNLVTQVLSNLAEVKARQGSVYIFTNKKLKFSKKDKTQVISMPACGQFIAPLVYVIPMQLLSYYVAIHKKTNIDQPRNLAKSVTVE